jgi:hypothetical protein
MLSGQGKTNLRRQARAGCVHAIVLVLCFMLRGQGKTNLRRQALYSALLSHEVLFKIQLRVPLVVDSNRLVVDSKPRVAITTESN